MRRLFSISFALLLLRVFSAQNAEAEIPLLVSYQGFLTTVDSAGVTIPVTDTLMITFKIYDHETAGISLWSETDDSVKVVAHPARLSSLRLSRGHSGQHRRREGGRNRQRP
jgi:hypothetical protein